MAHLLLVGHGLVDQCLILLVDHAILINVLISKANMVIIFVVVEIGCFVQPVEQTLVLLVFALIFRQVVTVVGVVVILVAWLGQMLVAAFELTLHLQVDHFGVVHADRALHRFLPHYLVNQVEGLLWELNGSNGDFGLDVWVDVD